MTIDIKWWPFLQFLQEHISNEISSLYTHTHRETSKPHIFLEIYRRTKKYSSFYSINNMGNKTHRTQSQLIDTHGIKMWLSTRSLEHFEEMFLFKNF